MIYNAWKNIGLPITKLEDIELDGSIYDIDDADDEEAEQQFAEDDEFIVVRNKDELSQESDFLCETENGDKTTLASEHDKINNTIDESQYY
jgi:PDZ domain-containing secreted protein